MLALACSHFHVWENSPIHRNVDRLDWQFLEPQWTNPIWCRFLDNHLRPLPTCVNVVDKCFQQHPLSLVHL